MVRNFIGSEMCLFRFGWLFELYERDKGLFIEFVGGVKYL